MQTTQNRRRVLAALAATGAAAFIGPPQSEAQEGRLETTTVRIGKIAGICIAPQYLAEELLRAEGFTDVRYVTTVPGAPAAARSRAEKSISRQISRRPHRRYRCWGTDHDGGWRTHRLFRTVCARRHPRYLGPQGQDCGRPRLGLERYTFVSGMASYVGLEPAKDIRWVTSSSPKPMDLFVDGKIDAFLGLPPEPQELRARNVGQVIFNSATDRPWSQYFCCMPVVNRDYVRKHPVATKRAMRDHQGC